MGGVRVKSEASAQSCVFFLVVRPDFFFLFRMLLFTMVRMVHNLYIMMKYRSKVINYLIQFICNTNVCIIKQSMDVVKHHMNDALIVNRYQVRMRFKQK